MNKTIVYNYDERLYNINVSTPHNYDCFHICVNDILCSAVYSDDLLNSCDSVLISAIKR